MKYNLGFFRKYNTFVVKFKIRLMNILWKIINTIGVQPPVSPNGKKVLESGTENSDKINRFMEDNKQRSQEVKVGNKTFKISK